MAELTYGLIGHPVEHSLSPAMQNAAFAAAKIDAEYKLFNVAPDNLEVFLRDLVKNNIAGANVTIPHKVKAKEYIEKNGVLDKYAERLGAVNTIKVEDGKLKGFNTDGPGFYRSLVEDLKFEPEGKTVFVLGAGGAARAIIMYLGNGPKKIYVDDIETRMTEEIKKHYEKYYDRHKLEVVKKGGKREAINSADLLIQATPVGMDSRDPPPIDIELLHPGLRVYDLVYNNPMTKLVEGATKKKLHATTGLGMLLYQGAMAFELWTGKKAPVDVMKKALKGALKAAGA
ncbi:MAG: shikimate dehydrogenase [Omnitrophica bacterium RIFCSPLOWO2_12_FULL_45_13]|nr:MAG: shikimate dehydrogenase [Omnitrophica bacterium RIFCSPLOWO2_12_FULL_45_13]